MPYFDVDFQLKESDVVALTAQQRTATEFQMTVSIAYEDGKLYKNFKYPRFRNFYGYAQIMSGAYVVDTVELKYVNQEILQFRDQVPDQNDGILCIAKAFAEVTSGVGIAGALVYLGRQRYTSVRFRFQPGIIGNLAISWATLASACGNEIRQPDPRSGEPVEPNNGGSPSGNRPDDQGNDPYDRSPNDGDGKPGDGLPTPPLPFPTPPGYIGKWVAVYSGYNAYCAGTYPAREYVLATASDPNNKPLLGSKLAGSCGSDSFGYDVTLNGMIVDSPRDVTSYTLVFK